MRITAVWRAGIIFLRQVVLWKSTYKLVWEFEACFNPISTFNSLSICGLWFTKEVIISGQRFINLGHLKDLTLLQNMAPPWRLKQFLKNRYLEKREPNCGHTLKMYISYICTYVFLII